MGPPPVVDSPDRRERHGTEDETNPDDRPTDEVEPDAILAAFDDPDCRSILRVTGSDARSASEIAARCGLPRSTTYRKLDDLVAAGLLAVRARHRAVGRPPSEYVRRVETVTVSVGTDGGLSVSVEATPGTDRNEPARAPQEVQ